jgi:DNA-binding Xre family transcriptional regulator
MWLSISGIITGMYYAPIQKSILKILSPKHLKFTLKLKKMGTIEVIKKAMAARNMNNRKLSESSGINQTSISLFLTGRRKPDLNSLESMMKALKIKLVVEP